MSTSMEISEDEAARPAFTIQDEGIGISSEALPIIRQVLQIRSGQS